MKYYYGIKQNDRVIQATEFFSKGTTKTQFKNLGRVHFFTDVSISGYAWDIKNSKWIKLTETNEDSWYISHMGKGPHSAKAFNRYVHKLLKEYDFPQGTVIQLSGRFNGIGMFCIVGGKS